MQALSTTGRWGRVYIEVGGCGVLCRLLVLHEALEDEAMCILGGGLGEPCRLCLPHEAQQSEAMCMSVWGVWGWGTVRALSTA